MKLILEITEGDSEGGPRHHVIERYPVAVGRAYHNDIILADPYAGERHFSIDWDGSAWTITDGGSVNPTQVNARALRSGTAPLSSGDTLKAGGTTLRVFAPDHPVDAAVRLQKANPAFLAITRQRNVWAFFALAVCGVMGWTFATVWSDDTAMTLAASGGGASVVIFVWAGLWSVTGRLIRRRAQYLAHVGMMSLYLALGSVVAWISAALDFLFNENLFALFVGYLMNGALLAVLVYGSLSVSTLMKKRKRIQAAALLSGGLILGIIGISFARADKFDPDPPYPYVIVPYLERIAVAETPDQFMNNSEKIFESRVFNKKDDKKPKK